MECLWPDAQPTRRGLACHVSQRVLSATSILLTNFQACGSSPDQPKASGFLYPEPLHRRTIVEEYVVCTDERYIGLLQLGIAHDLNVQKGGRDGVSVVDGSNM